MALSPGTRLGPYEILARAGAGGMGEVYRATDTRLSRTVAIKVLPSHLIANEKMRRRFEHEARAISKVTHPRICSLYDVGQQDDVEFLVLEYLEGETLESRLKKGPLPFDQVVRYGMEIAEALEGAHRLGVTHRDLKPGNIMLTKSGVKILDFGLAKLRQLEDDPDAPGRSEAMTNTRLTEDGILVGTLQYMAPEQLEGKEADERADIFALGATLYEMATGRQAFAGPEKAALISAILTADPRPPSEIQSNIPGSMDQLIHDCLIKNREERIQSAHDVFLRLRWIQQSKPGGSTHGEKKGYAQQQLWILIVLALAAAIVFLALHRTAPAVKTVRFQILPPAETTLQGSIAVSPDGAHLAFVATNASGNDVLWIHSFDSLTSQSLPGTENASYPFWSPDGQWIGFFADGKLKKTKSSVELPQILCDVSEPRGGTWNRDSVILFSADQGGGLYRVSADGGTATQVSTLDSSNGEGTVRWPYFLPDNRHYLYYALNAQSDRTGIYVGALDSKEKKFLVKADSNGAFSGGHLFYSRGQNLMSQPFDAADAKLSGDPSTVTDQMWIDDWVAGLASFSTSDHGVLAYRTGGLNRTQILKFDRTGNPLGAAAPPGSYGEPCLSADQTRLLLSVGDPATATTDVWSVELSRSAMTRLTFGPGFKSNSLWSPDGSRILFCSYPEGAFYQESAAGGDHPHLLLKLSSFAIAEAWSADGQVLLYESLDLKTNKQNIWTLPLSGDRTPKPFLENGYNQMSAQLSTDGHWLAYSSDETGRWEVYVQSFPNPGERIRISTDGGAQPKWRGDGNELFFVSPDKKIMAVELKKTPAGIEASSPKILFQSHIRPLVEARNHYTVSADGQVFYINATIPAVSLAPIVVTMNEGSVTR